MRERLNTVVIGGGQAGLALSYYLTEQGREHVVLEKDRVGEAWRSRRWDSFTLVTPNRHLRLPGFAYQGDDPDGFMPRGDVVRYLDDYVALFNPPLRLGVAATSVRREAGGDGLIVETDAGRLAADNVVIATGTFQRPKLPACSQGIAPHVVQVHSSRYRNPAGLPPGAVLVAGSGQSGCQIAEELYQSGRDVYLCTGSTGRAPRRYRGRDLMWWLEQTGFADRTVDDLASPQERFRGNPQMSGKDGGHSLNLHQFASDGVVLLGRLKGADGAKVWMADDLMANLTQADTFAANITKSVDMFIAKAGIDVPPADDGPPLRAGYDAQVITELDLDATGIRSIVWATGYTFDYSLAKFPIFDAFGYPLQRQGVTDEPGLYFLGLNWMHTFSSGVFYGIARDAAHVAEHIARRAT